MNPSEVERARGILLATHHKTIERLVSFVLEHEEDLLQKEDYDSTGASDRLAGFQNEIFVLGYLLTSLPVPPPPAAPLKPKVEKGGQV
jgi:hypothetical protein